MRALLIALPAALALTACGSMGGAPPPVTPLARYTLRVEPGVDRIALAVHDGGLSANQIGALDALAGRYAQAGGGWLRVEAPAGDDPVAGQQAYAVRAALTAAGVPAENILIAAYNAPDPRAPVLAGFETVQAVVPDCSTERRAMRSRYSNQSSLGLGCAVTANMAAQIANPRDIQSARPMIPVDSGRSAVVFANYRNGQTTSTPQEQLVQGQIARAVD
jgi:pilus assembly protein CpaD